MITDYLEVNNLYDTKHYFQFERLKDFNLKAKPFVQVRPSLYGKQIFKGIDKCDHGVIAHKFKKIGILSKIGK